MATFYVTVVDKCRTKLPTKTSKDCKIQHCTNKHPKYNTQYTEYCDIDLLIID